jgi:hypothetical protein
MDQISSGDSTAKELIIQLLERLEDLDRFARELDRNQEALMKFLLDVRPELRQFFPAQSPPQPIGLTKHDNAGPKQSAISRRLNFVLRSPSECPDRT